MGTHFSEFQFFANINIIYIPAKSIIGATISLKCVNSMELIR